MKTKLTTTACLVLLTLSAFSFDFGHFDVGRAEMDFSLTTGETVVTTRTNTKLSKIKGVFWIEWIVETNDAPRVAMEGFDSFPAPSGVYSGTNIVWLNNVFMTNGYSYWYGAACEKEHLDRTEQTVTKYVSSNLVSFLVWRGQTNRHYLESIPITNIVHHWHWDKKQVWTN